MNHRKNVPSKYQSSPQDTDETHVTDAVPAAVLLQAGARWPAGPCRVPRAQHNGDADARAGAAEGRSEPALGEAPGLALQGEMKAYNWTCTAATLQVRGGPETAVMELLKTQQQKQLLHERSGDPSRSQRHQAGARRPRLTPAAQAAINRGRRSLPRAA